MSYRLYLVASHVRYFAFRMLALLVCEYAGEYQWLSTGEQMTDEMVVRPKNEKTNESVLEIGGLRFDVFFTIGRGPTTEVYAKSEEGWVKLFMFDEFMGLPHYHVPGTSKPIRFDRASLGQPHLWYLKQLHENLELWMEISGFARLIPTIDFHEVASRVGEVASLMDGCFTPDFFRDPVLGVQERPA